MKHRFRNFHKKGADYPVDVDSLLQQIKHKEKILKQVEIHREQNPMLGLRGVRPGIQIPELTAMQVRAIFQAACNVTREGIDVHPEAMTYRDFNNFTKIILRFF
jgi:pyruvate, orthophosphate dikinase